MFRIDYYYDPLLQQTFSVAVHLLSDAVGSFSCISIYYIFLFFFCCILFPGSLPGRTGHLGKQYSFGLCRGFCPPSRQNGHTPLAPGRDSSSGTFHRIGMRRHSFPSYSSPPLYYSSCVSFPYWNNKYRYPPKKEKKRNGMFFH